MISLQLKVLMQDEGRSNKALMENTRTRQPSLVKISRRIAESVEFLVSLLESVEEEGINIHVRLRREVSKNQVKKWAREELFSIKIFFLFLSEFSIKEVHIETFQFI